MADKPKHASEYTIEQVDLVRATCLYVATRLGDLMDDLVIVGCSGGGDSIALLHLFHRLSPRRRPVLVVAHLDHGMRRGSPADRAFVEKRAAKLGVPCESDRRSGACLRVYEVRIESGDVWLRPPPDEGPAPGGPRPGDRAIERTR